MRSRPSLDAPPRPVPAAPAACVVCCGPTSAGYAHCFACRTVARLLHRPLSPVLPAHLCPVPGPLYRVLMGYKESSVDEARRRFSERIRHLFSLFFSDHLACVTSALGGGVDLVMPVPSSSRPGRASLEGVEGLVEVVRLALGVAALWAPTTLERAGGEIGHMRPNPSAFAVSSASEGVRDARAVLLDDLYVSGSRAQSAAVALRARGARAVVIVPLGRIIHPDRFGAHAALARSSVSGNGHWPWCVAAQTGAGKL